MSMNNELLLESCKRLIKNNMCNSNVVQYYKELIGVEIEQTNYGKNNMKKVIRTICSCFKEVFALFLLVFLIIVPLSVIMNMDREMIMTMLTCTATGLLVGVVFTILYYYTRFGSFLTRRNPIKLDYSMSENYIDFVVKRGYVKVEEKELCLREEES